MLNYWILATALLAWSSCSHESQTATAQQKEPLRLECKQDSNREDEGLYLYCNLTRISGSNYWILTSNLILEGPDPAGDYYVYNFVDGERTENVLQYVPNKESAVLDQPVLFKPAIEVKPEELGRLLAALDDQKPEINFAVFWPNGKKVSKHFGGLIMQVKLVAMANEELRRFLSSEDIPEECRRRVAMPGLSEISKELTLLATSREKVSGHDECAAELSRRFDHIYSNELVIQP